jgi:hypothetical protein
MQTTTPLNLNGQVFPLLNANLAITSIYSKGKFEAFTSLRLIPTRLDENGNSVTSEEQAKTIALGSVSGIEGPEQEAMQEIYQAVQKYIIAKGL